jgi:hypothetical protein
MPATTGNAVIASGGTTSNAVDLGVSTYPDGGIVGFVMPATFTGASVSFLVSVDDSTYQALNDSSNAAVSITVTQAKTYGFKADVRSVLAPFRFIKFVSASSEGGARTIIPIVK